MRSKQTIGTLYYEKHLRRHRPDGTPVVFYIWTAEVELYGKTYRKKSKDKSVCIQWLEQVTLYKKGNGEFPARLTHPGEDPRRDAKIRRQESGKRRPAPRADV